MIYDSLPTVERMIDLGYRGNGCGNAWWNNWLARWYMWRYQVDFSPACLRHDAGIDSALEKSEDNRLLNDEIFYYNCMTCAYHEEGYTVHRLELADKFYAAVVFNSYKSYWGL